MKTLIALSYNDRPIEKDFNICKTDFNLFWKVYGKVMMMVGQVGDFSVGDDLGESEHEILWNFYYIVDRLFSINKPVI